MPALYVDTSTLVKRYVGEAGTLWVRQAVARPVRQRLYTALLAQPEVLSALQRKVRERTLTAAEAQRLARRVQPHFARRYRLVAITPARVTQANALVQAHPLRAYDALHLACDRRSSPMGSRRCCLSRPMTPCWRRPRRRGSWSTIRCNIREAAPKWGRRVVGTRGHWKTFHHAIDKIFE